LDAQTLSAVQYASSTPEILAAIRRAAAEEARPGRRTGGRADQTDADAPPSVAGPVPSIPAATLAGLRRLVGSGHVSDAELPPGLTYLGQRSDPNVARVALDTALRHGANYRALFGLFQALVVESGMANLPHLGRRNDHTSLGALQMQVSVHRDPQC